MITRASAAEAASKSSHEKPRLSRTRGKTRQGPPSEQIRRAARISSTKPRRLNSELMRKVLKRRTRCRLLKWLLQLVSSMDCQDLFYAMKPIGSRKIIMNYHSPQALRIFVGENTMDSANGSGVISRVIYGASSVMKTTGPWPTNYRVFPLDDEMKMFVKEFLTEIRRHRQNEYKSFDFQFNFLEIKIYLGPKMFQTDSGETLLDWNGKPLNKKSNKIIRAHCDVQFDDNGIQKESDSVNGMHPTLTYNIGCTRKLEFIRLRKRSQTSDGRRFPWEKSTKSEIIAFSLSDNSVFLLSPEDEKPKRKQNTLFKEQHQGTFREEGISIGLVFRSVKDTSYFHQDTNLWLWTLDEKHKNPSSTASKFVKRTEVEFKSLEEKVEEERKTMDIIKRNVVSALKQEMRRVVLV